MRRGPALIRAVFRPVVWSWGPFRKLRFVITVACRQLSLGRRPPGDLSYSLMRAAVPVSTRDKLRFPRRLASYAEVSALVGLITRPPENWERARPTAELVDGHELVAGDAGAFGHPRPRHPRRRPSRERQPGGCRLRLRPAQVNRGVSVFGGTDRAKPTPRTISEQFGPEHQVSAGSDPSYTPKNPRGQIPALTYEPGGRTFESCWAHFFRSAGTPAPRLAHFTTLALRQLAPFRSLG